MLTEYSVYKAIMAGLELKLTGMGLFEFVKGITECTMQQFEDVYEEIMQAWSK